MKATKARDECLCFSTSVLITLILIVRMLDV